ncbi:alpha/beta-hydrolase [Neoconidiobolus thromboides FSU 785]|nr:alpha/beta-hydrolase [Neoconidiobolus thromboides FSU 785]
MLNYLSTIDYYWAIKHLSIAVGVLSSLAFGGIYYFQSSLIYLPNLPQNSRKKIDEPSKYNLPFEDVVLRTKDGVRIGAYLIKREDEKEFERAPTLIYFHANAGNFGMRLPIAEVIYRVCKCNILMLSYRGYAFSEGVPDEKGLKLDAEAALDYILSHDKLKNNKIVLYGQSIGGAVAIDLASKFEDKVHGLVLENTFLSLPKLIPCVMPTLKYLTFLCHQIWDSEKSIRNIQSLPTLFLSGAKDSLIPPSHMKSLYDQLPSNKKQFQSFPNGDHNDTFLAPEYFKEMEAFFLKFIL